MYHALSWGGPGFEATKVHACDIKTLSLWGSLADGSEHSSPVHRTSFSVKGKTLARGVPDSESRPCPWACAGVITLYILSIA